MLADQKAVKAVLARDPILMPLLERLEFPEPRHDRDPYFDLLRSIAFQQLSGKAAQTIFERFLSLFPDRWPQPEYLLALSEDQLRSAGLSRQKAGYLQNIAAFFLEEDLMDGHWTAQNDEEIIGLLTRIKGVGRWTAEMVLLFTLNRPDVFPADDLGIQTAMERLYGINKAGRDRKKQMMAVAEAWQPYRSFASKYLWQYLDA